MDTLRVIFFGSHKVALPLLQKILEEDRVQLSGIVTQPDRPVGRGRQCTPTVIADFGEAHGIPVLKPERPDESVVKWMQERQGNVILVMAYGHILRDYILNFPEKGIWNLHGSILPKYRGASPVETAVAMGEKMTGVSLMQVVPAMDAGAVADTEIVAIDAADTSEVVYEKIAQACPRLLSRNWEAMRNGTLHLVEQNSAEVTFTRKLDKMDGAIDFSLTGEMIANRMRAFHAKYGTYFSHGHQTIKVGEMKVMADEGGSAEWGTVLKVSPHEGVIVKCDGGAVAFMALQRPGGKMLSVREFLNGYEIKAGEMLNFTRSEPLVFSVPYVRF